MRKIQRPPLSLPTLTGQGKGAVRAGSHLAQRQLDAGAALRFPDHWNEPDVRGALYAMHGRVCAYCLCALPQNDPGDVEHFRPKSTYWWLAYEFGNYLLSCAACNRNRKREKFPLPDGAKAFEWADRDRLHEEKFLLLDPAVDAVESWLEVKYVDKVKLYQWFPADGLAAGGEPHLRARTTIDFFKLNENVLLVRQRLEIVGQVLDAVPLARQGDRAKIQQVRSAASRFRPQGMAVRQMLANVAPELVPSEEEDLINLVLDLALDFQDAEKLLALTPRSPLARRFRAEALWALAVLWKHPPAGSPALVESCLRSAGCWDEVAKVRRRI